MKCPADEDSLPQSDGYSKILFSGRSIALSTHRILILLDEIIVEMKYKGKHISRIYTNPKQNL
jgi:hypothetical protein